MATDTGVDRTVWMAAETLWSSCCPLEHRGIMGQVNFFQTSEVILVKLTEDIFNIAESRKCQKFFIGVKKSLLKRGGGVSQQEMRQAEDQVFLHPLPVQREHRDALRVGRQRVANVPETITPLQQLQDLKTHEHSRSKVSSS